MAALPYFVIVGGLIGAIGGAGGGAIIGAVATCIAVLSGTEIIIVATLGTVVGILNGCASGGIAWGIGHSISQAIKICLKVGAATGGIASFGAVFGSATAPVYSVITSAVFGTLFGLSALGRLLSLDITSRNSPLQTKKARRGAKSISTVARAVEWLRNYVVAFFKGGMFGALGGLIGGTVAVIGLSIGLGFYVGDPLTFIVSDFDEIGFGSMVGIVNGILVGAIVAITLKATGRTQWMKRAAILSGATIGAAAYATLVVAALKGEFVGASAGAAISTIWAHMYTIAYHKTESTAKKPTRDLKK